jgi:curved DNA-binding protein CbpA
MGMEHAGPWRDPGDPYRVLGVSADASQQDIARAYRQAVQHAHPDAQPHDPQAAVRFRALTDAYDLLRDPDRRTDYDRGHPARKPGRQPPRPGHAGARPRPPGSPFLLGVPPSQLIWAGPVQIEPPTAPAANRRGRGTATAEFEDRVVILGPRPGQVWGWPW